jgi:hypothetical protein
MVKKFDTGRASLTRVRSEEIDGRKKKYFSLSYHNFGNLTGPEVSVAETRRASRFDPLTPYPSNELSSCLNLNVSAFKFVVI